MIAAADRFDLAAGVSLSNAGLADGVRECSWPLNNSGVFILERRGRRIDGVVDELAAVFDLQLDAARFDVLQFLWTLNSLALVNVQQGGTRFRRSVDWLGLALRLAPAGAVPAAVTCRRPLDTGGVLRGVVSSLRASGARALAVVASASVVAVVPLAATAGDPGRSAALAVGLGVATGVGIGLHEAGHVASLRGVPSALVTRGCRTYVLHAPVGSVRRSLVAMAGPGLAVAIGLALVFLGAAGSEPAVATSGLPFAAHALSLTVLGGDGRAACGL